MSLLMLKCLTDHRWHQDADIPQLPPGQPGADRLERQGTAVWPSLRPLSSP